MNIGVHIDIMSKNAMESHILGQVNTHGINKMRPDLWACRWLRGSVVKSNSTPGRYPPSSLPTSAPGHYPLLASLPQCPGHSPPRLLNTHRDTKGAVRGCEEDAWGGVKPVCLLACLLACLVSLREAAGV